MSQPLAIDLYCGLGGWTHGLLAEGYEVVGFDIERHAYDGERYPAQLVIQDVRTIHGAQLRDASLIVASPPCQRYSYMAMPWTRAKAMAMRYREEVGDLNELFDACFRIQREASDAAGRYIPMVVENVRGAIPWVGRSRWNYGSYHLWGDVPLLMPIVMRGERKMTPGSCCDSIKQGGEWFSDSSPGTLCSHSSRSLKRKATSARIAKIPLELAAYVARVYRPAIQAEGG